MSKKAVKQVIVIRSDLGMRRGKEIAQGSHASSAFMTSQAKKNKGSIKLSELDMEWLNGGQTKITVKVNSEEELTALHEKAKKMGLKSHMITDAGRTEFNGVPTLTALAIGPNYADDIDKVTGNLKLY